jgi:hypothetical protein
MLLPARLLAMFCYMIKVGRAHIQGKIYYPMRCDLPSRVKIRNGTDRTIVQICYRPRS